MLQNKLNHSTFGKNLLLVVVILFTIIWLFPLWNVIVSSTKSLDGYLSSKPWNFSFDTNPLTQFLNNVKKALAGSQRGNGIASAFYNTTLYSITGAFVSIVFASLAAYALACLPIKGRFFIFILLFSGTIFPIQVYLIPLFSLFQKTGLYDTKTGLILLYIAISIPFCVFLLRNWYIDVPFEILEAANIDGASELQTFIKIFAPLSKAPFITLFLFQSTWIWNDFILGTTYARSAATRSLMALLAAQQNMYSSMGIPSILASAIIVSLPTVLLVLSFRNTFFKGMALQFSGSSK